MTTTDRLAVQRILHPTDFSRGSEVAFVHALKLTLANRAAIDIVHVNPQSGSARWGEFPQIRKTLQQWGLLRQGATHSEVARLGVRVQKSRLKAAKPIAGLLERVTRNPTHLMVLATHQRSGWNRWFQRPVSVAVADKVEAATLFIPYGVEGFVNPANGSCSLRRVLVPVHRRPHPQSVVDALIAIFGELNAGGPEGQADSLEITMLHVGDEAQSPSLDTSQSQPSWNWTWVYRKGSVVREILAAAKGGDLIAMATQGNQGWFDSLLGSTTKQILRKANCPILAVPALSSNGAGKRSMRRSGTNR